MVGRLDPTLLLAASHPQVAHTLGKSARPAAARARAVTKIGVGIRSLGERMSPKAENDYIYHDQLSVLVESREVEKTEESIESLGGSPKLVTPTKLVATLPRSKLGALARRGEIGYVEASTRLRPTSDLAHESSGLVHGGAVTVPQRGTGVIVGIIDTGIDVSHPAFRSAGSTRVINYLDQETGQEFSRADIDSGAAAGSVDVIGHGTHVAGIAAGNGAGSPGAKWHGVAPEADLAIVKTTFDTADIAVAIKHVFDLAAAAGQPCVVNLSLGGHFGGHDGSSVAERMIDDLSGDGRVVVVSAGNEAVDAIHASTVLQRGSTPPDRWVADFLINRRTLQTAGGPVDAGLVLVQVWHGGEDAVRVSLRSPTGNLFTAPVGDRTEFDLGNFFVEASHHQHPYSQDHATSFFIVTDPAPGLLAGWSIIAEDDQAAGGVRVGGVHAWILNEAMGHFTAGDVSSHLVGMPGTAFSAITVASYASRKEWPSRQPNASGGVFRADAVNLEDISFFSSMGPTRDGHNKPDIAGPGQFLLAPLSADTPTSEIPDRLRVPGSAYAALQGTSMSAPYVTGAIALLLEKDPSLNWSEIKRRLMKSARQDEFTRVAWNPRWGYGRLDVPRLLEIEPAP